MTVADTTLAVFTFFNSLRFLAYVPQIVKAAKDQSGAEAISFGTWALFLASHASAMAYAIENQGDWKMASLFLSNALGCGTILLIAAWKRSQHRRRRIEEDQSRQANRIQYRHFKNANKFVSLSGNVMHPGSDFLAVWRFCAWRGSVDWSRRSIFWDLYRQRPAWRSISLP
jgi:hypothetical protein